MSLETHGHMIHRQQQGGCEVKIDFSLLRARWHKRFSVFCGNSCLFFYRQDFFVVESAALSTIQLALCSTPAEMHLSTAVPGGSLPDSPTPSATQSPFSAFLISHKMLIYRPNCPPCPLQLAGM